LAARTVLPVCALTHSLQSRSCPFGQTVDEAANDNYPDDPDAAGVFEFWLFAYIRHGSNRWLP